MADTTQRMRFQLDVDGEVQASRKIDRFNRNLKTLDGAATAANTKLGAAAGALGNFGSVIAGVNPEVSRMSGLISTAGSAMGTMTAALGGVAGIAAGGLLAALAVFVSRTQAATDAQNKLSQATNKVIRDMQNMERAARLASGAMSGLEGGATLSDVRSERASVLARLQAAQVRLSQAQRPSVGQRLHELLSPSQIESRLREQSAAQREVDRLRARLGQVDQQLAEVSAAAQRGPVTASGIVRTPGNLTGRPGLPAEPSRGPAKKKKDDESSFFSRELQRRRGLQEIAGFGLDADFGAGLPSFGEATQFRIGSSDRGEALVRAEQRHIDLLRERMTVQQEATMLAVSGAGQALNAAIVGAEGGARAALRATGDALVAQGIQHGFQGAFAAFTPGGQAVAGPMLGLAALEIAQGKLMGAAFAAPSIPGMGAGAVRASGVSAAPPATQTVINVNGIADQRVGEQVVESLRQVKRNRGAAAVEV